MLLAKKKLSVLFPQWYANSVFHTSKILPYDKNNDVSSEHKYYMVYDVISDGFSFIFFSTIEGNKNNTLETIKSVRSNKPSNYIRHTFEIVNSDALYYPAKTCK